MAKIIDGGLTADNSHTHLRDPQDQPLCGLAINEDSKGVIDGILSCPECAKIALAAIELSTKKERKLWRDL